MRRKAHAAKVAIKKTGADVKLAPFVGTSGFTGGGVSGALAGAASGPPPHVPLPGGSGGRKKAVGGGLSRARLGDGSRSLPALLGGSPPQGDGGEGGGGGDDDGDAFRRGAERAAAVFAGVGSPGMVPPRVPERGALLPAMESAPVPMLSPDGAPGRGGLRGRGVPDFAVTTGSYSSGEVTGVAGYGARPVHSAPTSQMPRVAGRGRQKLASIPRAARGAAPAAGSGGDDFSSDDLGRDSAGESGVDDDMRGRAGGGEEEGGGGLARTPARRGAGERASGGAAGGGDSASGGGIALRRARRSGGAGDESPPDPRGAPRAPFASPASAIRAGEPSPRRYSPVRAQSGGGGSLRHLI